MAQSVPGFISLAPTHSIQSKNARVNNVCFVETARSWSTSEKGPLIGVIRRPIRVYRHTKAGTKDLLYSDWLCCCVLRSGIALGRHSDSKGN